jgi:hypothetical protein
MGLDSPPSTISFPFYAQWVRGRVARVGTVRYQGRKHTWSKVADLRRFARRIERDHGMALVPAGRILARGTRSTRWIATDAARELECLTAARLTEMM